MTQDLIPVQADTVGDDFFLETPQTRRATADLWRLLALSRQEPRPWIPPVVLCGEPGSGRTTLANRFIAAAQRNVACDLVAARVAGLADEEARERENARTRAAAWADRMVRDFGSCPELCAPAAWAPEEAIRSAMEQARIEFPALPLAMTTRPDRDGGWLSSRNWRSPGNSYHHPTRRTSLVLVDGADRLLSVSPARRRECVDLILDAGNRMRIGHPLTWVFVGGPALAALLAELGATQVVAIEAMANDAAFAQVCAMMFATRDAREVAGLHRQSGGLMGRLRHIARMRGLEPPFNVAPDEIRSLPAPAKPT